MGQSADLGAETVNLRLKQPTSEKVGWLNFLPSVSPLYSHPANLFI